MLNQITKWGQAGAISRLRMNGKNEQLFIETKRSKDYGILKEDSEKALNQIEIKEYAWDFLRKGYEAIAYGISFAEKECFVMGKIIA